MSRFIFIRHGETAMAGKFCGHSDPDLNRSGEQQIASAADVVASLGVGRIYSSDLLRASRTAEEISQRIGIRFESRRDLREIYFGKWEGLSWHEIEYLYPDDARRWIDEFPARCAPSGESYAAFTARVDVAMRSLLLKAPETTAIVTHRGVMRYALTQYFDLTEEEAWIKTASYGAVVIAEHRQCQCECEVLS
jgi:alpha-ribazole phosphatase/probable phosphoglycerate mutase